MVRRVSRVPETGERMPVDSNSQSNKPMGIALERVASPADSCSSVAAVPGFRRLEPVRCGPQTASEL